MGAFAAARCGAAERKLELTGRSIARAVPPLAIQGALRIVVHGAVGLRGLKARIGEWGVECIQAPVSCARIAASSLAVRGEITAGRLRLALSVSGWIQSRNAAARRNDAADRLMMVHFDALGRRSDPMSHISIGDVSLHVVIQGEGEPLLLVHGFPLDHSQWTHQIAHFARSHQVIAPDLRGFGSSDVTAGTVQMEQFADDLASLLTALGVARPVCLCGLSMGGYIAFAFVRRHRERLRSLVLCDTRAAADSPETRQNRWETAERVLRSGPGFLAENMVERLVAPATRRQRPELVAEVQAVIRSAPREGVAAALRGMAERSSAEELLPHLDLPTLVLVGEHDLISPPAEMRELARKIPAAQFVLLAEAGHLAPWEQPAAMNAALDRFLQETNIS